MLVDGTRRYDEGKAHPGSAVLTLWERLTREARNLMLMVMCVVNDTINAGNGDEFPRLMEFDVSSPELHRVLLL